MCILHTEPVVFCSGFRSENATEMSKGDFDTARRVETLADPWKACSTQAKRQGRCRVFRTGGGSEVEQRLMLFETPRCVVLRLAPWRIVRGLRLPQLPATTTTLDELASSWTLIHLRKS